MRVGDVVKESKQPKENQSPKDVSVPMALDPEGDLPVTAQKVQGVPKGLQLGPPHGWGRHYPPGQGTDTVS